MQLAADNRITRIEAQASINDRRPWPLVHIVLLCLLCALPVLLYLPLINEPFEGDEGVYATIAQGLLRGDLPYRDLFDHKPPLIYANYAISFLLFGEDIAAPRLLAALSLSLATLLVFWQSRYFLSLRQSYASAAIFALSCGLARLQLNANTEVFLLLPLTAAMLSFSKGIETGRMRWLLISGMAAGLAVMTKQVAVWNLAVLVAAAGLWHVRPQAASRHKRVGSVVGGALISVGVIVLPFVVLGALDDFLYANLKYNWLYGTDLTLDEKLANLGRSLSFLAGRIGLLVAGTALALPLIINRRREPFVLLLAASGAASALAASSTGRFYPHYYVQMLPFLAPLTVLGFTCWRFLRWDLRLLFAVPMIYLALATSYANAHVYLQPDPAARHLIKYPGTAEWHNKTKLVADYARARTKPDDRIYNIGGESQLYFYADRRPAERFIYDRPFRLDPPTLTEALARLEANPPPFVIDTLVPPIRNRDKAHPAALQPFLNENYDFVERVHFADVYMLKARVETQAR